MQAYGRRCTRSISYYDTRHSRRPRAGSHHGGWGVTAQDKSALYAVVLIVGLALMISPLPEGTLLLSLLLSYFGYQLTGSLHLTLATYLVTFLLTLVLIKKLHLIAKSKTQLENLRSHARAE
jgi:hypothetical protein